MLNVKHTGLYYKWLNFSSESFTNQLKYERVTLCSLFWHSVLFAGCQIMALALVTLISLGMGSALSAFFGTTFAAGVTPWYILLGMSIAGLISIGAFLSLCIVLAILVHRLHAIFNDWRDSKAFDRSLKESIARDEELHFGNIYQKMRIFKKDKLCPFIRIDYGE